MRRSVSLSAAGAPKATRIRVASIGVLCCGALVLSACGGGSGSSDGEGGVLKVGVLIPGNPDDGGFMQSAAEGVKKAETDLKGKVKIQTVDRVSSADMSQALSTLASSNDLIISIGGQTDSALRRVVQSFPDKKFVEVGGPPDTGANLAAYDPKQAQIAFVAGALAALESKTGKVQFISGVEQPPIVNTANEFKRGAEHVKPDIKVVSPVYTGDYDDVAKAKEAALAGIAGGVDVQYQILNDGLQGLLQAAKAKNTKVIGGPLTHSCDFDPAFLGFTKSDIGGATRFAIDQTLDETWKPAYVPFGLDSDTDASGIIACKSDPATKKQIDTVIEDIRSGKIKTI